MKTKIVGLLLFFILGRPNGGGEPFNGRKDSCGHNREVEILLVAIDILPIITTVKRTTTLLIFGKQLTSTSKNRPPHMT